MWDLLSSFCFGLIFRIDFRGDSDHRLRSGSSLGDSRPSQSWCHDIRFYEGLTEVGNGTQVALKLALNLSLTHWEPRPLSQPETHFTSLGLVGAHFILIIPWRAICWLVYCPSGWHWASPSRFTCFLLVFVCRWGWLVSILLPEPPLIKSTPYLYLSKCTWLR